MSSFEIAQIIYQKGSIQDTVIATAQTCCHGGFTLSGKDSLLKALDLEGFEMVSRDDILTNSERENYSESY